MRESKAAVAVEVAVVALCFDGGSAGAVVHLLEMQGRVMRLSLGRRLVNLLPVAQRTNAFTNGVVSRPWVVGRELESHVHHENVFLRKVNFLTTRI